MKINFIKNINYFNINVMLGNMTICIKFVPPEYFEFK